MMVSLGICQAGSVLPPPFELIPVNDVVLVTYPVSLAKTARCRLALQSQCARELTSFLPLAPRQNMPAGNMVAWLDAHQEIVRAQLRDVEGLCQFVLTVNADAKGTSETHLLRARFDAHQQMHKIAKSLLCPPILDVSAQRKKNALFFATLVSKSNADLLPGAVATALKQHACTLEKSSLTGPWPVSHFCSNINVLGAQAHALAS